MTALEEMHSKLERAYTLEREGERSYDDLLKRGKKEHPKSYHFLKNSRAQQDFAEKMTAEVLALASKWSEPEVELKEGSPQPWPKVRMVPEV